MIHYPITKQPLPPGDFAIWIIIYMELITFGALFVGYAFARRADIELFNQSQLLLDQRAGFVNTLILITSSYFVVKAVKAVKTLDRATASKTASRWIMGTMILGGSFIFIKLMEFADKFEQGITLSTNTFFMFYLILTVFHFMHVLLGLIIWFNVYRKTTAGGYSKKEHSGLETAASYWHLVDLLWIILFPLIYIMR